MPAKYRFVDALVMNRVQLTIVKEKKSDYDCTIGVSGGKDSTKQAITARDELGLKCLLVN